MGAVIDIAEKLPLAPNNEAGKERLTLAKDKALGPRFSHIAQGAKICSRRGPRRIYSGVMGDDLCHRPVLAD
jgi:hypothetical protein